jgi:hypothetical protein
MQKPLFTGEAIDVQAHQKSVQKSLSYKPTIYMDTISL